MKFAFHSTVAVVAGLALLCADAFAQRGGGGGRGGSGGGGGFGGSRGGSGSGSGSGSGGGNRGFANGNISRSPDTAGGNGSRTTGGNGFRPTGTNSGFKPTGGNEGYKPSVVNGGYRPTGGNGTYKLSGGNTGISASASGGNGAYRPSGGPGGSTKTLGTVVRSQNAGGVKATTTRSNTNSDNSVDLKSVTRPSGDGKPLGTTAPPTIKGKGATAVTLRPPTTTGAGKTATITTSKGGTSTAGNSSASPSGGTRHPEGTVATGAVPSRLPGTRAPLLTVLPGAGLGQLFLPRPDRGPRPLLLMPLDVGDISVGGNSVADDVDLASGVASNVGDTLSNAVDQGGQGADNSIDTASVGSAAQDVLTVLGGLFGGGQSQPDAGSGDNNSDNPPPDDGSDNEDEKANQPQEVSGAFLDPQLPPWLPAIAQDQANFPDPDAAVAQAQQNVGQDPQALAAEATSIWENQFEQLNGRPPTAQEVADGGIFQSIGNALPATATDGDKALAVKAGMDELAAHNVPLDPGTLGTLTKQVGITNAQSLPAAITTVLGPNPAPQDVKAFAQGWGISSTLVQNALAQSVAGGNTPAGGNGGASGGSGTAGAGNAGSGGGSGGGDAGTVAGGGGSGGSGDGPAGGSTGAGAQGGGDAPVAANEPSEGDEPQTRRYLRIKNDTREKVTVYVQYRAQDDQGNWEWFPADPKNSAKGLGFEFKPGEESFIEDNGWQVNASRVRVWAVSASGAAWNDFKAKDLWLVPEVNKEGEHCYYAPELGTYLFTVSP